MQRKVQAISQQLAGVLTAWPEVEAVVLGETAESGVLDPYFAIALDVYHRGELPAGTERRVRFGSPAVFETVPEQPSLQDRFLLSELPVRVRYQEAGRFEELLERIESRQWVFHDSSPGLFHRLAQGQALYVRSPWLEECRRRMLSLPDHYWGVVLEGSQRAFSYALTDLKASALRDDGLFFIIALARFVRALVSFLFALNRRFEPGLRQLSGQLARLERIPDGFAGRFESLLREEPELDRERKCEIADLLARSALAMV
jgi:hypothetical protein